ncbi:alpha-2-macroglobulin-like [Penaeus monodon]|uniref:alpha-2-macroglobulin-like n=1 Tax=Penaeus monodon TaxID=6687 RepID=UPI0018A78463|nr:alpha-2-macroglobulin-like [Penaeus monodon]
MFPWHILKDGAGRAIGSPDRLPQSVTRHATVLTCAAPLPVDAMTLLRLPLLFLAFLFTASDAGVTRFSDGFSSRNPISVNATLPSHAVLGETLPILLTVRNNMNQSLFLTMEVIENITVGQTEGKTACLASKGTLVESFKIRPDAFGIVPVTLGVGSKRQRNVSCDEGKQDDSEYIYIATLNITVLPEGFKREKVLSNYACGLNVRDGNETLPQWEVEAPPEAVGGSVKAWVAVANSFLALPFEGRDSLLLHGRGDIDGLADSATAHLQHIDIFDNRVDVPHLTEEVNDAVKRQNRYRLQDASYTTLTSRDRAPSSWMTAYVLTIASIASSFNMTRSVWNWQGKLQRNGDGEDGCFEHMGDFFHDSLRNETTGEVSSALNTAYTTIAVGISAHDGPPSLSPSRARDCLVKHVSSDPFVLAIKAYALACVQYREGEDMLKDLFAQAVETDKHIYWELGDAIEEVQVASYAALAIMRRFNRFEPKLEKLIRWIAEQENSQGGFNSVFDTMTGVRALIYHDRDRMKFDVEATIETEDTNHTLTFNETDSHSVQRVDLPVLPVTVNLSMTGSGCALFKGVVQYNVMEHYNSNNFSLNVSTDSNSSCSSNSSRINVCASYLPNRQSNLVAVEVTLVSGYTPLKEDLEALVKDRNSVFAKYDIKGNKVILYVAGLSAEEACADFGVIRELEVEDAKPGVVVVYDYYQPEFAVSANYRLAPFSSPVHKRLIA